MFNLNLNFLNKIKNIFFPFYKDDDLKFVFKRLNENSSKDNQRAMFVGGCVRKYLMNKDIDDIDIATSLTVDQIREKFKETKFKIIETGTEHGTITLMSEKHRLELTTLRKDIITDGRHAQIEYTDDWNEDSKRRDFTINAIYLDINGKIFDPQDGVKDLKNNVIKFIGDPQKRIEEDYLRIIRFIRFSLEYASIIEDASIEAIKLNLDGIKKLSKERILLELFKILKTKKYFEINHNNHLSSIFLLIFPELIYLNRLEKLKDDLFEKHLDVDTILSVLLIDDNKNHEYFSHKYNISNDLKAKLDNIYLNYEKIQSDKIFFSHDLKKNIYFLGKKKLILLNILNFAINKKVKLIDYLHILNNIKKAKIPNFPFDGNFLKKQGMKEGVLVGKTLKLLENEWLNNNFKISEDRTKEIIKSQTI